MNYKKSGSIFLIVILVHLAVVAIFSFGIVSADKLSGVLNLLLGQIIVFVPMVIMVAPLIAGKKTTVFEVLAFHKIKVGSIFMLILYALMLLPLTMVFNLISMLFTTNQVTAMSGELLNYNSWLLLFIIGIVGPLSEECVFRGAIYGGMRKSISARGAIIMSAVAFGLMHMNFNQALYAIPLGIFMALAVEATGSLWSSFVVHMTINLQQTATMLIANKLMPGIYRNSQAIALGNDEIYMMLAVYLVIALVTTAIACCCIVWVAKHENRMPELKVAVVGDGTKSKLFNWQLVLGMVVALGFMTFMLLR